MDVTKMIEEVKKVGNIATMMMVVGILNYLIQVVTMTMVGHLGDQLALSSVAIATSITNVTGFSLLIGLCGALDTLCGQAYGAKQYNKLLFYAYSAIITLIIICFPISLLWYFSNKLLSLTHQDLTISNESSKFSISLIPQLFGYAILDPVVRYLQSQSLTKPLLFTSFFTLCLHVFLCWILIFKMGLGSIGAGYSASVVCWVNLMMLGVYIKSSSACKKTKVSVGLDDALGGIWEFICLALPSALMVCMKWWSFEALTLMAGLLPNPEIETSVFSICLTISTLHFTIPLAISIAASIRVSNELGAGNAEAAREAVFVTLVLASIESVVVSMTLYFFRNVLGYVYSNEKQIVEYVATSVPMLCVCIITDSLQMVLSGVAKGSGIQDMGAYVNLVSFYLVGIPVAVILGFVCHMKAKGLWFGILIGSILQFILLSALTFTINWEKQVIRARQRVVTKSNYHEDHDC